MRSGDIESIGGLRWDIVEHTRGIGVELGRGPVKLFPHFVGIREEPELGEYSCKSFSDLYFLKDGVLDFVVTHPGCKPQLSELRRVLKDGGKLVSIDDEGVRVHRAAAGLFALVVPPDRHEKSVCVVRYGAIGDTLQATSILPELKRQGYHVTWLCEPTGHEYLREDPHIDAFLVNDKDQVPIHEIQAYWSHISKRFDRFINLSESVEGALLKLPQRSDYLWPKALRHEMCNHNYLEFMAKMAELPFSPEHHFYETDAEAEWARDQIEEMRAHLNPNAFERSREPYVVMWALAGSSVHKFYPHQDAVIARILTDIPEAYVVLVGDPACAILEAGWENEPRIKRLSGRISVRETLALAKWCNLVIGPETGVLNAVAFEPMSKIVLLSHSTAENLTKHWANTAALASVDTLCYPCHRLHYTRAHCPEDKPTGASQCMAELPPALVWDEVWAAYAGWKTVRKLLEAA